MLSQHGVEQGIAREILNAWTAQGLSHTTIQEFP